MTKYTYDDFRFVLDLIESFNKQNGKRTKGISYNQLNSWLFKGYKNLITHVETDRQNIQNNISERRCDKNGLYNEMSVDSIVRKLINVLEIDEKCVIQRDQTFMIELNIVEQLKREHKVKLQDEEAIYLLGSTYQGKQLQVAPRSIFILNLKTKKVLFDYYGAVNKSEPKESLGGEIIGEHLVYLNFSSTKNKKMYILNKGTTPWKDVQFISGTYIGDDGLYPMAGAIVLEKVKNHATAKDKLHQIVPTWIQYRLLYTQIRDKDKAISDVQELNNNPFYSGIEVIKENFQGVYYGCYLSTQGYHSILRAKLVLKPNGSAVFYGIHNPDGEEGWIYVSGDKKKLYLRFKYYEKLDIFKYFITLVRDGNRLYGSYGGGSNFPYLPETGRIVFIKVEDKNADAIPIERIDVTKESELNAFLEDKNAEAFNKEAINFLLGKSKLQRENDFSDTPSKVFENTKFAPKLKNNINLHPNHPENAILPIKYQGIYEGYIVRDFNVEPIYRIQRLAVEIHADKKVEAFSTSRKYSGNIVKYVEDKKIGIFLSHKEEYPEIYHILQQVKWNNQEVLRGTYSGTGRTAQNNPIGGRILLIKKKNISLIKDITLQDFNLKDIQDINELEKQTPGIFKYFLGFDDTMIEGYSFFDKTSLLPISHTKQRLISAQVSGLYLSFRIRTDLETISIVPLKIDDWGNVRMKSTRYSDQNNYSEYHGVCEINNGKILSFNFYEIGNIPSYAFSKFNKSRDIVDKNNNNILMGVFSSSNTNEDRVFCCQQILIFQSKDCFNYDVINPEVIPVPIHPSRPSDRFIYYNDKYKGIMDYLIGDEYNIIRMGRGPRLKTDNKEKTFKNKINYGKVFYLASLKLFEKGQYIEANKMWYSSIFNGFNNKHLLDELKEKIDAVLNSSFNN